VTPTGNRCRRILEATNAGHYFADCGCGWGGGVHASWAQAASAWRAHRDGRTPIEPVKAVLLVEARAAQASDG